MPFQMLESENRKKAFFAVRVDQSLFSAVQQRAKEEGSDVSTLIRSSLIKVLEEKEAEIEEGSHG